MTFSAFLAPRSRAKCLAVVLTLCVPATSWAQGALEPTPADEETYSETITAIADLADQTYVQVQFMVSNVGLGDGNGGCRVLIVTKGASPWSGLATFERDEWSYAAPALSFGPCAASSDGGVTRIVASVEGTDVDLTIEAQARRVEPPGARLTVGERSYSYGILVPWARASASLRLPKSQRRTVPGHAFIDHSRSTTLPAQLASSWVRFRGLRDRDSVVLLARFTPEKGELAGWWWRQEDTAPRPLGTLVVHEAVTGEPARGYRIEGTAGATTFALETSGQLYRYAPVEEYRFLGRVLRAVVGNPITRTFRAQLRVAGAAPIVGILEVQSVL